MKHVSPPSPTYWRDHGAVMTRIGGARPEPLYMDHAIQLLDFYTRTGRALAAVDDRHGLQYVLDLAAQLAEAIDGGRDLMEWSL